MGAIAEQYAMFMAMFEQIRDGSGLAFARNSFCELELGKPVCDNVQLLFNDARPLLCIWLHKDNLDGRLSAW